MARNPLKHLVVREALLIGLDYLEMASLREKLQDFGLAFGLSIFTTFVISLSLPESKTIVTFILSQMGTVVTALSILAGFNTTSMAIIASSSSELANSFRSKRLDRLPSRTYMEQIISFFSWAIIVQLAFIIFSFIILGIFSFWYITDAWIGLLLLVAWLFGATYSIMLTLRNAAILYYYLIGQAKHG